MLPLYLFDRNRHTLHFQIRRQKSLSASCEKSDDAERFLKIVRNTTEIHKLTAGILREFVEKIYVHQAVKSDGSRTQQVDIVWNFIGVFDPPESGTELEKKRSA